MSDFENKHYDDTNNEETPRPDSNSNENPDHPGDKKPDEKAGQDDTVRTNPVAEILNTPISVKSERSMSLRKGKSQKCI